MIMDFFQVKGNTWCLQAAELIPVYRLDARHCILLDSGWSWEREALKEVFEQKGLTPVGAIGTHGHKDHVGNHAWLKETYGTKLCMPQGEAALVSSLPMLKVQYSMLSPKTVEEFTGDTIFPVDQVIGPEDGEVEFAGGYFYIHHTPGHTVDHICVGTQDGVCYVSDLVLTGSTRKNARLPYNFIHRMARASMEKMRDVPGYDRYIIAHQKIVERLDSAVKKNLDMLDQISEYILELTEQPVTWEGLMTQVLDRNQLYTGNEIKIAIYEQAVQRFVDDLKDTGRLAIEVSHGVRRYRRI